MVHKKDAVEVIYFMLQANGQKALCFKLPFLTLVIQISDPYALGRATSEYCSGRDRQPSS